jgi:hypothetical protein
LSSKAEKARYLRSFQPILRLLGVSWRTDEHPRRLDRHRPGAGNPDDLHARVEELIGASKG